MCGSYKKSFITVADEYGFTEENRVLRKWYELNGAIHIGTKMWFFPIRMRLYEKRIVMLSDNY